MKIETSTSILKWFWIAGVLLLTLPMSIMTANAVEKPADIYKNYCWQCHGKNGNGQGVNVNDMPADPRNHSSASEMSPLSDEDIFKAIKEGGQAVKKSVLMPPWGSVLTDEEIRGLVKYLRTLCQCQHS